MKLTGILQDMLLYEGLIHSYEIGAATKILNNWSVANDKFNQKLQRTRKEFNLQKMWKTLN